MNAQGWSHAFETIKRGQVGIKARESVAFQVGVDRLDHVVYCRNRQKETVRRGRMILIENTRRWKQVGFDVLIVEGEQVCRDPAGASKYVAKAFSIPALKPALNSGSQQTHWRSVRVCRRLSSTDL